ncbi:MAG: O-antigen ligase family protein [Sphingobacteriales bacterium]
MPFSISHTNTTRIFWGLATLLALCLCLSFLLRQTALIYIPFAVLAILFILFYDIKVLFFLLLFFIPFSIEYSVTSSLSTDLPDEPMMVSLAGCIILYMVYQPSVVKRFIHHPLLLMLFLQLIWVAITVLFSYDQTISLKYMLAKSWYILAFVFGTCMLIREKRDFVIIGFCFCVPMLVIMMWTLYNHAFSLFSFKDANHVMQPFFRNHVNYSSLLACIIPILLLFYHFASALQKRILRIIIIITLFGIVFSYARGAWLALIVGAAVVYLIRKKLIRKALIVSSVSVLLAVTLLVYNDNYTRFAPNFNKTIFHSNFGEHIVATYELTDVSTAERFYRWIAGARMSIKEPITGYGPNNFYHHYKQFADNRFKTWVSANEDHSSVHNYFLLLLIEQGIVGMLLFYFLLFAMFLYAQHLYHRVKDEFYKQVTLAIAAILGMITTVNMLSDLIETDKIGSLFYVCLGLLIVIDLKTRNEVIQENNAAIS